MIVLQFTTEGECRCIYTEDFPLEKLGHQRITRVSTIEWDHYRQLWQVRNASTDEILFESQSRRQCLDWEHENQDRLLA